MVTKKKTSARPSDYDRTKALAAEMFEQSRKIAGTIKRDPVVKRKERKLRRGKVKASDGAEVFMSLVDQIDRGLRCWYVHKAPQYIQKAIYVAWSMEPYNRFSISWLEGLVKNHKEAYYGK